MSRDPSFKVLSLMPRVSVLLLVLMVLGLGLGLKTSLWLFNKCSFSFQMCGKKTNVKETKICLRKYFTPCHLSSSAPVERILSVVTVGCSHVMPHRARIDDTLLSQLVFLHCDNALQLDVLYADSMSVCCLHVLTLTVAMCEDLDYGCRVVLMLSTSFALNKMHYSVLPRHSILSCCCCVMFDFALALVLVLVLNY